MVLADHRRAAGLVYRIFGRTVAIVDLNSK
jgi:hypothetical protein